MVQSERGGESNKFILEGTASTFRTLGNLGLWTWSPAKPFGVEGPGFFLGAKLGIQERGLELGVDTTASPEQ